MKNDYAGFISEHTAEFVITKAITNLCKSSFNSIVPIFPWMSREGGQMSRQLHSNDNFRVIAVYPRRPKIDLKSSDIIFKINHELIQAAVVGENFGVPFLAVCPQAKNFWELNDDVICRWIKLSGNTQEGNYHMDENLDELDSLVFQNMILESKFHNLNSFFEMIRTVKYSSVRISFFGGHYKPIYFLIK